MKHHPTGRWPAASAAGLLLLTVLAQAGLSWAGEEQAPSVQVVGEDRPLEVAPRKPPVRSRPRFRYELTKIEVQLESLSAFESETAIGGHASDHVLFDELSEDVEHGVRRATRRAMRDYLLDAAEVDRVINVFRGGADQGSAAGGSGRGGRMSFDVRIHSFLPEVEMGYRLGGGQLKLSVGTEGEIGVRYGARGVERANVGLSFDGDDTLRLNLRFGL